MKTVCPGFDPCFDAWCQDVYRLCFVLTRDPRGADRAAFQSFLRLGVRESCAPEYEDRIFLLQTAVALSADHFLRSPHRLSRPDVLAARIPFSLSTGLYALLQKSFSWRCATALTALGLTPAEIRKIAGRSAARKAEKISQEDVSAFREIYLSSESVELLSDRIYERFSVRSVSVENRIHSIRERFDRAVPFLALLVLLLFAIAVLVSLRINPPA